MTTTTTLASPYYLRHVTVTENGHPFQALAVYESPSDAAADRRKATVGPAGATRPRRGSAPLTINYVTRPVAWCPPIEEPFAWQRCPNWCTWRNLESLNSSPAYRKLRGGQPSYHFSNGARGFFGSRLVGVARLLGTVTQRPLPGGGYVREETPRLPAPGTVRYAEEQRNAPAGVARFRVYLLAGADVVPLARFATAADARAALTLTDPAGHPAATA